MVVGESSRVTEETEETEAPATVREALASERAAISECLSRAFEDDPVSRYLFPKDRSRFSRLASFYRVVLGMMSADGAIYTDEQLRGAAVWRAPSPPQASVMYTLRDLLGILATLRGSMGRAMGACWWVRTLPVAFISMPRTLWSRVRPYLIGIPRPDLTC